MVKLSDFYSRAIESGMENDPRGREMVREEMDQRRKEYEALSPKLKEGFDVETLEIPYPDSRILIGKGNEPVGTVLVGIDMDVGEVLLADALRARNKPVDLLLSHHPSGKAFASLHAVMAMQADILGLFGVPINIAEDTLDGRIKEIERKLLPLNHMRTVDAARLLDFPFICLHTPADNMVAAFLQRLFDEKKPRTLDDILDILSEIPEYREARLSGTGPRLLVGSEKRKAGRIFVDMTGGTEGSKEVLGSLSLGGINTIVGMHLTEEHRKEAEKNHINVVIAGHIASDNLGMNLLLDSAGGKELDIIECSGFRRIAR